MGKTLCIVHSVDTEGPLYESIEATFSRLKELFNLEFKDQNNEVLDRLKKGLINLNGKEKIVQNVLNSHLLDYNDTWDKIQLMLDEIMSDKFRKKYKDDFKGNWKFSWHCLDHVGFEYNPRRRDMGYHNIFDYYKSVLSRSPQFGDDIQWHFHPMSTYKEAHRCATSFVNSPELYQILIRRIIEREWFPSVFRAGFQSERPDSNWFLEQWIPFDLSNMSLDDNSELEQSIDFKLGRSGNWRNAPSDWSLYHPSHDNYQIPGNCRRIIARSLNILNRIASINEMETDKAFLLANKNKNVLLGISSHDFRDLRTEVDYVYKLLKKSQKKFPDVKLKFCTGLEGFREVVYNNRPLNRKIDLNIELFKPVKDDVPNLLIDVKQGEVFGPQPFLAIETKSRRFIHDNLDIIEIGKKWGYAFHSDTLPIHDVNRIGVACNDFYGNTFVKVLTL